MSHKPNPTIRVAAVEAEPEWLNLQATVEKTCSLIEEAASSGHNCSHSLSAGSPDILLGSGKWSRRGRKSQVMSRTLFMQANMALLLLNRSRPLDPELSVKYIQNSLQYESPEMERIQAVAVDCKINVVLGFSENDHNSLYMSQCVITDDGNIKARRRKIKPTHMERTIFGDSTGDSLNNVVDTSVGRVGALLCWEHINPLWKYHTYHQRELIHIAAWPVTRPHAGGSELWGMTLEGCRNLSRTYAIESSSFVLHTTTVISEKGLVAMRTESGSLFNTPGGGASAVYGPDGRQLTKGMSETEEGIVYADLDTEKVLEARCFVDSCGHYSRPDLLWLGVDSRVKKHLYTNTT